MTFFQSLTYDHEILDNAAGTLVSLVKSMNNGAEVINKISQLINFFQNYMIEYHIVKEEWLINELIGMQIPADHGPLYYYNFEHKEHQKQIDNIKKHLVDENKREALLSLTLKFCTDLWEHIDKENSVLFPESEKVIGAAKTSRLNKHLEENNNMYDKVLKQICIEIIQQYPPVISLPESIRGDGCTSCRFYDGRCNGIELEWWSDYQWEDLFERE